MRNSGIESPQRPGIPAADFHYLPERYGGQHSHGDRMVRIDYGAAVGTALQIDQACAW
jgi:hypothetical protein